MYNQLDTTGYGRMGLYGQADTGRSLVDNGVSASSEGSWFDRQRASWLNMDSAFGGIDKQSGNATNGWAMPAIQAGSSILNAHMGMKQYGMAKKNLQENKRQFNLNFDTQAQTLNTQMEDRQRSRVASNPNAHMSVSDYMNKNRVTR